MRKTKRIIALVVVAMFLLSLAAPAAMAATKEDAFGRLNSLSVAVGDTTGDPMFDKNFTRAEAAAIMVNLSGMKAAINAATGPTKFQDVPSNHWGTGVINLAVGAGIITGYPDGTYKPDKDVTYAEMSAMLVGVLGYTPKLQGTWPSNVIGKAAQLGLLDGVSVSDYNAAAVRSNVFVAADNSLDTKPLKETKDGYEEDTKTLMESKLNVTVKPEGTITAVPNTSGVKNKVSITYTDVALGSGTLTVADGVDANSALGLKVEAWVKDSKVFFFNVKTAASDIVTDKMDGGLTTTNDALINAGDVIHVDDADKDYTLDASVTVFKNYVDVSGTAAVVAAADVIADDDELKLVLNNGKVKYLIATAYTTKMVEKVNTSDEKLTFEVAGSLDLRDKVNTFTKDGKTITLADIKAGDVVDYISTADSRYIVVSNGVVEGTLDAAASAGNKVTLSGTTYSTNDDVKLSTNGGDTYSDLAAGANDVGTDYSSHFGKEIKAFTNKDGKIAFIIATEGDSSNYIPVMVKDIKRTTGGATDSTYLFIAKFDGTETYYEVTKDTKLNGTKITDANIKLTGQSARITGAGIDEVERGETVKITLTSDNKVDSIKEYSAVINKQGATANFTVNKTASTLTSAADGIAYKVDANTKILKVKSYRDGDADDDAADAAIADYQDSTASAQAAPVWIDDVSSITWSAMENLTAAQTLGGRVSIVKDNGVAQYVVLFTSATATSSSYKYGMVMDLANNVDGTTWTINVDGANITKLYDNGAGAKKDVVKFKLNSKDEVDSAALITAKSVTVGGNAYSAFKVKSVDKSINRMEVIAVDAATTSGVEQGSSFWIDYNDRTEFFDTEGGAVKVLTIDDINADDIVELYDAYNKDDDDTADGVFDFIERKDK